MSTSLDRYTTQGGISVQRQTDAIDGSAAIENLLDALDTRRGAVLASSYEYPGRYTRWDMGFVDPPLMLTAQGRQFTLTACNDRGRVLVGFVRGVIERHPHVARIDDSGDNARLEGTVRQPEGRFPEEDRSRQPSVFSVIRAIVSLFASPDDLHLGLYGTFAYDLAFQFEPIALRLERPPTQRDLVLYLPDELYVVDHQRDVAQRIRYEFSFGDRSTGGFARGGASTEFVPRPSVERAGDHAPGHYSALVEVAKESFARGDLFEVVPGQVFYEANPPAPSELFRRLRERNPSPYGFIFNLGSGEYLVGASPEMYVRVEGSRVETCPISGTIVRGTDAIADAARIKELLMSEKDESELTMCTDVDRNDKSRICEPGSVKVIGRRQIELYSRLIHTVDHVEGTLRPGFDALDAFLTHMWAVTVTGAPKLWAMRWIEDHERTPRAWYGGAIGLVGFDGRLNTGLTLRTVRIVAGVAEVRVGATLLFDSDPSAEEAETELKAAAFLDAVRRPRVAPGSGPDIASRPQPGVGKRVLLVDHQDSFVHTLANYLRQAGATVTTLRAGFDPSELDAVDPHLVVLSPGPGTPKDFDLSTTIDIALTRSIPIFGVCLGLQGIAEHFGATLGQLEYPMHGKPSTVSLVGDGGRVLSGLPSSFTAGRYHSLFAARDTLPPVLHVTAETADGVIMGLEHATLPIAAVQFHPESILTLDGSVGLRLIESVVARLALPA